MIGRLLTFALVIGWSIGSLITSEAQFNEAFEETILELQGFETTKTDNWALSTSFYYFINGLGLAMIGFVATGIFLYQLFPVPSIFVTPIVLFFILDIILFGLLRYFLINGLFTLLFLGIEKTGLVNWGESFETRRQD